MPYDNRQRQETARNTRARIIEAAKSAFLARGFGGTTIRQVAEDAGVSQETIYKTFGGKAGLLKSVYDVSLVGDDDDIPLAQRPEAIAVHDAQSPAAAATAYAELAQSHLEPDRPAARVLLGAGDTDKALAEFVTTTDTERHVGSQFYVRHWAARRVATQGHHPRLRDRHGVGSQLDTAPLAPARSRLERRAVHRVARRPDPQRHLQRAHATLTAGMPRLR